MIPNHGPLTGIRPAPDRNPRLLATELGSERVRFPHCRSPADDCRIVRGLPSTLVKKMARLLTPTYSYTWANEVCADNNEQRALVISSMNGFQYAVAAWLPILTFPQLESPTFRKGFPTSFGLVIAAILCVVVIQLFVLREQRAKRLLADQGSDFENETRTSDTVKGEGEEKTQEPSVVAV